MWGGSASQKRDFFSMIGNIRRDALPRELLDLLLAPGYLSFRFRDDSWPFTCSD